MTEDMVLVNRGALQVALNMLRRDADEGRHARGEIADEIAASISVSAEAKPVDKYAEYRRGVREAASLAYLITQNRQGKKAEDVLDRIIKSLSDLADTVAPATPAQSIADTAAGTKVVAWIYREAGKWDVKLGDKPETADKAHPLVFAISNPSAELTAMQERFNLVAAINASYVDEIRALRESIADTAGAALYHPSLGGVANSANAANVAAGIASPAINAAPDRETAYQTWTTTSDYRPYNKHGFDAGFQAGYRAALPAIDAAGASDGDVRDAMRYKWLRDTLHGAKAGGGVEVNEQLQVYESPEPGEEVRVYWYQETPVGFYEVKADTLDVAIDAAIAKENGDE